MGRELKIFATFVAVLLLACFLPLATPQFGSDANPTAAKVTGTIVEAFVLLQWYARNHTLACVIPALFIAGAITTFLSTKVRPETLGAEGEQSGSLFGRLSFGHGATSAHT